MLLVETVVSNAKFHSSQDRTNQSSAVNDFRSINQGDLNSRGSPYAGGPPGVK